MEGSPLVLGVLKLRNCEGEVGGKAALPRPQQSPTTTMENFLPEEGSEDRGEQVPLEEGWTQRKFLEHVG